MNLTRHTYATSGQKVLDFALGFFGWYLLNSLLWGCGQLMLALVIAPFTSTATPNTDLMATAVSVISMCITCVPMLANIGLLIYFGLTRYWITLGALSAFVLTTIMVLCLGILVGATCLGVLSGVGNP